MKRVGIVSEYTHKCCKPWRKEDVGTELWWARNEGEHDKLSFLHNTIKEK